MQALGGNSVGAMPCRGLLWNCAVIEISKRHNIVLRMQPRQIITQIMISVKMYLRYLFPRSLWAYFVSKMEPKILRLASGDIYSTWESDGTGACVLQSQCLNFRPVLHLKKYTILSPRPIWRRRARMPSSSGGWMHCQVMIMIWNRENNWMSKNRITIELLSHLI